MSKWDDKTFFGTLLIKLKTRSMPTKKTVINTDDFKKWLSEKHGLSGKVPSDIASRAKRVALWVSFDSKKTDAEIVDLMKVKTASALNIVIKSQLKRAVRLYREFSK